MNPTDFNGRPSLPDSEGGHGEVGFVVRTGGQRQRELRKQDALPYQPQASEHKGEINKMYAKCGNIYSTECPDTMRTIFC